MADTPPVVSTDTDTEPVERCGNWPRCDLLVPEPLRYCPDGCEDDAAQAALEARSMDFYADVTDTRPMPGSWPVVW